MERSGQDGATLMAQALGSNNIAENQESSGTITIPISELLNLYRLLAKKDSIIEKKDNIIKAKNSEIEKKDLEISDLKNNLQIQHDNVTDKTTGFDRKKVIALFSCSNAEVCADILIEEILPYKDKAKPKKGLFPLYCAIKNGWLERPSYNEFIEAFPGICANDASYSQYIPDGRISNYEAKPKKSFDVEAHCESMQTKLSTLLKTMANKN